MLENTRFVSHDEHDMSYKFAALTLEISPTIEINQVFSRIHVYYSLLKQFKEDLFVQKCVLSRTEE